jgi:hypothetical protein
MKAFLKLVQLKLELEKPDRVRLVVIQKNEL